MNFDYRLVCRFCKEEGKTSRLTPGGGSMTLAIANMFYAEDGTAHIHDPNISTNSWSCSNGHRWVEKTRKGCPAPGCDQKGSVEIIRAES